MQIRIYIERFKDMTHAQMTIRLGNEYDESTKDALADVLRQHGAIAAKKEWGIGGSQEMQAAELLLGADRLLVESETYMGLSITGPEPLVHQIAEQVKSRLGPKT